MREPGGAGPAGNASAVKVQTVNRQTVNQQTANLQTVNPQPLPAPGFYGKLLTHADFVGRRLPPAVRKRWDDWLQECLPFARRTLADDWIDTYLHSPLWRFALAEGVLDAHRWAGVMMPSVDQVGRQFPLTLIARLAPGVGVLHCVQEGQVWYEALERLALSSLVRGFRLDDFDRALLALPPMCGRTLMPAADEGGLHGRSLWWSEDSHKQASSLLACPALPSPTGFCTLLDGESRPGSGLEIAHFI